jgi:hypothetical protein
LSYRTSPSAVHLSPRAALAGRLQVGTLASLDNTVPAWLYSAVVRSSNSLALLAEEWVLAKALSSSSTRDLSSAARRGDLARAGRLLDLLAHRPVSEQRSYDLSCDLAAVLPAELTVANLRRVLLALRGSYAPATAERTVSTLRGFCRGCSSTSARCLAPGCRGRQSRRGR